MPTFDNVGSFVFSHAERVTRARWRSRSSGGGCGASIVGVDDDAVGDGDAGTDGDGVTVISEQTVGAFDVVVLSARNFGELLAWLDRHGYAHGVDDDTVLDEYVADRWVFTAMRVDGKQLRSDVSLFDTEPVALVYETDVLRYPLRLAALSASRTDATRLVLYTIGPDPMTFDGARTRYSNHVSQAELDLIRADAPNFGALIAPGDFVTKLQRDYGLFEMKDDFDLRVTEQIEFQEVRFASFAILADWMWVGVLAAYLALHHGLAALRRGRARQAAPRSRPRHSA